MKSISKKHIKVGEKKVFVQVLGAGPALVMLHPSPHSSDMLLPMAEKLASHYTVICIDTPGYGRSDGLDNEPSSLSEYTELLHQLFDIMRISKLSLYGSATGSQLAIRYALEYEDMVSHVFLDNAAHFDDDLRTEILARYFPDLTPSQDGGHLKNLWDIVSNMFVYFPWCMKTPKYALDRPKMPAVALHSIAMDYLKAGANYAYAYRVAFIHERGEHVQQLKSNTTIFRWVGSIVLPYIDALVNHDFPDNVQTVNLNKDPTERTENMVNHMISKSDNQVAYKFPESLGEVYQETKKGRFSKRPPEITLDGSYLNKAWELLYKKDKDASPDDIQQQLINWYIQ